MSVYNSDDFLFYYSGAERRARVAAGDPSFSRSSTAMRRDRSEIMREVDEGAYRRNWVEDENGFLVPANRLEAARTNSITRSEDFSDAAWTGAATVTTDDAVAPDGTTTADLLEDTGTGAERREQAVTVPDDSLARAGSVFVKKGAGQAVRIQLQYTGGSSSDAGGVQLDLSNGNVATTGEADRVGVEDWNENWWRLWCVTANNGSGNTTLNFDVFPAIGPDENTIDGSTTGSAHFWGAQLEGLSGGASFPSSYIATAGSAVSRAADDLSFPISWGPQELTIYCKFVEQGGAFGPDLMRIVQVGDNANENLILRTNDNKYEFRYDNASAIRTTDAVGQPSIGDVVEVRGVVAADGAPTLGVSINGGSEITDTEPSSSLPSSFTDPTVYLAQDDLGTGNGTFDFISGPIIAPGVRTMDECRQI